jgi:hypothetical protein
MEPKKGSKAAIRVPDTWPRQTDARARLGVSRTQLFRLVQSKRLRAVQDGAGRWRFDPVSLEAEVAFRAAPAARASSSGPSADGKVAAEATRLFAAGKTVRDVVLALEIPYATAHAVRQDYAKAGDDVLLSAEAVERLRGWLGWDEHPPTEKGLLEAVMAKTRRLSSEHTKQVEEWKGKLAATQQALAAAQAERSDPSGKGSPAGTSPSGSSDST